MANSGSFRTSTYDGAYLQFDWSLKNQNVANNQSVITWKLTGGGIASGYWYKAGNFKVVINGVVVYTSSTRIDLYSGTVVASGEVSIAHNNDGSKTFSASAEAGIYTVAVNCKGSGSWSLPSIGRASIPSINTWPNNSPNWNIGDTITIHMNRKSTAFTHTVVLKFGSYSYQIATGVLDNVSLKTSTIASNLYAQIPNANSGNGTIEVTTFNGNITVGKASCDFIAHVVNSSPTFACSYSDTNATTVAITGNNQKIIRNNSTLVVSISNAQALNSATLKSYSVSINGNVKSGSLSVSSATANIGTVNVSSDTVAKITIVDSRGNATTKDMTISVYDWKVPTGIVNLARNSNYYSDSTIKVSADYSSIGGKNTVTIKYRIKKLSDSSYGDYIAIQNNTASAFTADNEYEWNVQVLIADKIGSSTYNLILQRGIPIAYFDGKNNSVGINCVPKRAKSLEVNGQSVLGVVLYDGGTTGTAGTVTLSDSSANYSYIEIYFRSSGDNVFSSVKVYSPNGKRVHLGTVHYVADFDYAKFAIVSISGTTITFLQNYQLTLKNNGNAWSSESAIYITRVVGF